MAPSKMSASQKAKPVQQAKCITVVRPSRNPCKQKPVKPRECKNPAHTNLDPVSLQRRALCALEHVKADLCEIKHSKRCTVEFIDPKNVFDFTLTVYPDIGVYAGGRFTFRFFVGLNYPHDAPRVIAVTKVYHPNIDRYGNIALKILNDGWDSDKNFGLILREIQTMFVEPNMCLVLNDHAAQTYQRSKRQFGRNVARSMRGCPVNDVPYECCIKVASNK